jgi:HlyD family secretion protein
MGYSITLFEFFPGSLERQVVTNITATTLADSGTRVGSLGRLEPGDGVVRLAGPPRPVAVVEELLVEEGDYVLEGQVVAVLMGLPVRQAELTRTSALAKNADVEVTRNRPLHAKGAISDTVWRELKLARDVAAADVERLEAEVDLYKVKAPLSGRVLRLIARSGEKVGPEGILELGDTNQMYAVAEVYETDIGRVHIGQPVTIRSSALTSELLGHVEKIGQRIGKKDVLTTDPVADADARVIEVRIKLADSSSVEHLTNLRVDVVFDGPG